MDKKYTDSHYACLSLGAGTYQEILSYLSDLRMEFIYKSDLEKLSIINSKDIFSDSSVFSIKPKGKN